MKKFNSIILLTLFSVCAYSQTWDPVGTGVGSGPSQSVDVLNSYNGQIVAAGRYMGLQKWDGSIWSDFTDPNGGTGTSILVEGDDLYMGGQFTGGEAFKMIKQYDGLNWTVVGGSLAAYSIVNWNTNYQWSSIFKYNSNLYGVYDRGLLRFDSGNQEFVAVDDQVTDVGEAVSSLRFAGMVNNITYFMGMTNGIQRIFTWDDNNWDTLNLSNYPARGIYDAEVVNNELFIGGGFQNTNNVISGMLKWNGTSISEVLGYDTGIPSITKLYATSNRLYAKYSTNSVYYVGYWDGNSFNNLGGELTTDVNAIAEVAGITYAGGFFSSFSGVTTNNIVQYTIGQVPQSPAAPTDLTITVFKTQASNIRIEWVDNANNEQGFKVERSQDGSNFSEIADLAANSVLYEDMQLSENTTYYYRVLAYNVNGNSSFSNTVQTTTGTTSINERLFTADIYPNPVTHFLTISTKENGKINRLTLVDVTGRIVYSQLQNNGSSFVLDMRQYISGIYFLHVELEDGQRAMQKVIKHTVK